MMRTEKEINKVYLELFHYTNYYLIFLGDSSRDKLVERIHSIIKSKNNRVEFKALEKRLPQSTWKGGTRSYREMGKASRNVDGIVAHVK